MNLHKLLRFAFLCLVLAMVGGCSEKDSFEQPQLNVSEKDITFSNQMGEKTITVNTAKNGLPRHPSRGFISHRAGTRLP